MTDDEGFCHVAIHRIVISREGHADSITTDWLKSDIVKRFWPGKMSSIATSTRSQSMSGMGIGEVDSIQTRGGILKHYEAQESILRNQF